MEFTWAAAMAPLSTMACLWAWVLERATHRQLRPGLKQHYGLPIEPWPTQRPVPSALRRRSPEETAQKARPVSCGATKTALSGAVRRCQALSSRWRASSVRSSAKDTVWMQSTGQQSRAW